MTRFAAGPLDIQQLYEQYAPLLLRRIRRFYSREQAADVLQEVFMVALEKRHSYRGEGEPLGWLYGLATGHCLARLRNERRRRELFEEIGEVPWSLPVTSPESSTEAKVFLSQLWRVVDPDLAQVGVYYYVDQLSQEEIGAIMGVSGRTISTRLQRLQELATAAARQRST